MLMRSKKWKQKEKSILLTEQLKQKMGNRANLKENTKVTNRGKI